ncbi:MAG TPA: CHAT domain-containing protein [Thermoanaerobaculia bacterium]|nr:CHAT domain-containing protein [Thermoanaerobaculia bacterium]
MREPDACLSAEVVAAFIDGKVFDDELRQVLDHLRGCHRCMCVVNDTTAVASAIDVDVEKPARVSRFRSWWVAAAVAANVAGAMYLTLYRPSVSNDPHAILTRAAPRDGRDLEARASRFEYAPLRGRTRGAAGSGNPALDPVQMRFIGAAGEVLERTRADTSVRGRHAAAIAYLVSGRPGEASSRLREIASKSEDALLWSDLAASYYTEAVQRDDVERLAAALAAADSALRIDDRLPEALFNRALIVERLGLTSLARAAWQRYLDVDPESPWAAEAREHVSRLSQSASFDRDAWLQRRNAFADDADIDMARVFARRFPEDARAWGETELLARWAEATAEGDASEAAKRLSVARTVGEELVRSGGDGMLAAAVAAIDAADASRQRALARAHLAFRDARTSHLKMDWPLARSAFARAANEFRRAGSPVEQVALGYIAHIRYLERDLEGARILLARLAAESDGKFIAQRARLEWQHGLLSAMEARWTDAIQSFSSSIAGYEKIGEMDNAAYVRNVLAAVHDSIGQHATAQRQRLISLRDGREDRHRLEVAFDAAANSAALRGDWQESLSFLTLAADLLSGTRDESGVADTLLFRARVALRMKHVAAAKTDLLRASEAIAHIRDPFLRARAEARSAALRASLAAPAEAVPLLTRVIASQRARTAPEQLSELYLQRGRALAALRRLDEAASDFAAGIDAIQHDHRGGRGDSLPETRWERSAIQRELFEEAIGLAVTRGDSRTALAYAERARGIEPIAVLRAAADPTEVIVQYAALSSRLVIFVVKGDRIHVAESLVTRDDLAREVAEFANSASTRNASGFRDAGTALYARLLTPIADEIVSAGRIVFVPDETLRTVPFAALVSPARRYLVETHVVVVASSMSEYVRRREQPRNADRAGNLLLITASSAEGRDLDLLYATQYERDAIAALYPYGRKLITQTVANFEKNAAAADVIHFAGHAIAPNDGSIAALVSSEGSPVLLSANDIAAMRLRNTRVVILAACSTDASTSSLARAFVHAGVPSVVGTLWPIEDAAASQFFPRFHEYLVRGESPADALRATQLEWIRRPNASPGMWAAVQVIGT